MFTDLSSHSWAVTNIYVGGGDKLTKEDQQGILPKWTAQHTLNTILPKDIYLYHHHCILKSFLSGEKNPGNAEKCINMHLIINNQTAI